MKKLTVILLCASIVLSGCGNMNKTAKGTLIGAGSGAAVGAAAGAIIGKDGKSAAIGAAVGTAVGAGAGALIGKKMDKKAAELAAQMADADVEVITDANDLKAIKVTLESGILFKTSSSELNDASKLALSKFAANMKDMPDTDITLYGHTDNTGSDEYNQKLSVDRATSVANYLQKLGMAKDRMTIEGMSYSMPIADNSTAAGRLQNRRVEIFITANEDMIKAAEDGTLK